MHRHGHKYYIQESGSDKSHKRFKYQHTDESPVPQDQSAPFPLTRKKAIARVSQILKQSRGCEIPGMFNPMVMADLFWEQSKNWRDIASGHINAVAAACKAFVFNVLDHVTTPDIKLRILDRTVLPALGQTLEAAYKELKNIESDRQRYPSTYNHYFTDTLQKFQKDQFAGKLKDAAEEATVEVDQKTWIGGAGYEKKNYIHPHTLQEAFDQTIERDMDQYAAEQAFDAHNAYYKVCKSLHWILSLGC